MPTYVYNCIDCGTTYERSKSMKDSGTDKCDCGGLATKVMAGFNIGGGRSPSKENYVPCPGCGVPINPSEKVTIIGIVNHRGSSRPFSDN